MFRLRPEAAPAAITVEVEGRRVAVPEGASAAAAMLLAGLSSVRDSAVGGGARGPYCLMGACFECLAEIDGVANRQGCMVAVRPGMRIRRQRGARSVGAVRDCFDAVPAPRDDDPLSVIASAAKQSHAANEE